MKLRRFGPASVVALSLAAPAGAAMTVGEFIAKANGLRSPLAALAGDRGLLRREMTGVALQLKAEGDRRRAAGLPPRACPPKGAKMGPSELIGALSAIPVAERGISLKDGFVRAMTTRFPCR